MKNSECLAINDDTITRWIDDILFGWTGEHYNDDAVEKYAESYPEKSVIIDIFPNTILDGEKYYQVEVCYKRWREGDVDKKTFLENEKKYLDFIKMLWLYNTVDVSYDLYFSNRFRKGSKKYLKYIMSTAKQNILYDVQEWSVIEEVLKLALRGAGWLWIYFKEWEVLAIINEGMGNQFLFKDEITIQRIYPIIKNNMLYVLNREI